jgi:hypothetical protein
MRLYGVTPSDARGLIVAENWQGVEEKGNLIYEGEVGGMQIGAVLACDDMDTVITVYDLET